MRRLNGDNRIGRMQVDPHDHLDGVYRAQIPAVVHVHNGDVVADMADVSGRMLRVGAFHLYDESARCRVLRREVFAPVPSGLVTTHAPTA